MISEFFTSIILAVIQGITEWVPISSKGHLVLFSNILDFQGRGIEFDVALHFGTLMAVFVYFGGDIVDILRDLFTGKWKSEKGKLGLMILVATIPVAVFGLLFKEYFEMAYTSLYVTAIGFAITGVILMIGSLNFKKRGEFSYGKALFVGFSQILALFPGVSRSGTTISSGLVAGLKEKDALRFSFLMSIPAIFGASILELGGGEIPPTMIIPTLVSFVVGLLTIHVLLKYVLTSKKNLRWFALYVLLLALVLGIWLVFR